MIGEKDSDQGHHHQAQTCQASNWHGTKKEKAHQERTRKMETQKSEAHRRMEEKKEKEKVKNSKFCFHYIKKALIINFSSKGAINKY